MLGDPVCAWLRDYDVGEISGMELCSLLNSHLALHPEEATAVLASL